jgi:DNA-binding IclR family transcriptional regulator
MGIAVYSPSGACSQALSISGQARSFEGERRREMAAKLLRVKVAMTGEINPGHRGF